MNDIQKPADSFHQEAVTVPWTEDCDLALLDNWKRYFAGEIKIMSLSEYLKYLQQKEGEIK